MAVVVTQPTIVEPGPPAEWQHGFFNCCDSGPSLFCYGTCCFPCLNADNAKYLNPPPPASRPRERYWLACTCTWCVPYVGACCTAYFNQATATERYNLLPRPCDGAVCSFCPCCSAIQVSQEIKEHGDHISKEKAAEIVVAQPSKAPKRSAGGLVDTGGIRPETRLLL